MHKMKENVVQVYLNKNVWSCLNNYEDYKKWEYFITIMKKENKNYEHIEII